MQIKELAPRMHHAASLHDATDKSVLVTRVIFASQTIPPSTQETSGVFFWLGLAVVNDHRFQILKRSKRISPKIPAVATGHVWAPDYWAWHDDCHIWIRGRAIFQRTGYRWESENWEKRGNT